MDSFFSDIAFPIISSTVSPLVQHAGYLFNAGAHVKDLIEISKELNLTKEEVQGQIATAMAASAEMVATERIGEWEEEVQDIQDMIGKIYEDYNHRKTYLGGYPVNYWLSYRIGKRAAKVALEAKKLVSKKRKRTFDVVVRRSVPVIQRMLNLPDDTTTSTEEYLKTTFNYLEDDEVGLVGIWGMGGVGKTTILQRINNHPFVEVAGFDYVIWAVVSQEPNLEKLQKDIADRVGLTLEGVSTESHARAIYHYLKTKKFLLLLDDIWEPHDLVNLGIPYPSTGVSLIPKRKVVFTTRSEAVCDQMTAHQKLPIRCKKMKIECLQLEEAWELFLDKIGEGMRSIINSDKRVCSRAKKVADMCGGLPLALVVIAQTMSANRTWQEWEVVMNSLNTTGIQEMWRKGTDPFPLLKVSYDRLPDETIKNCFLCCALWPEDHVIWEPFLITTWLGMNLIDHHGEYIERYMRGYSIVQILKRACLLQKPEEGTFGGAHVKMHDIIRGMALWIISSCKKRWMIRNRAKLKKETEDATEWREAEVISLTSGRSGTLPQHPDCPNLSSLMLPLNCISVVPEGFFQNMYALTFLDLSFNQITELPQAIGGLLRLRHLDLKGNSICSLPMELGNLSELKGLNLDFSESLRIIPQGLILRLRKLELLTLFATAFDGWDTEGQASIEELVCSSITSLGLDIRRFETLKQLSRNPIMSLFTINIRDLVGTRMLPLRALLQVGNTRCTLHCLYIEDCDSLEEISASGQCDEGLDSLERLVLRNLPALEKITFAGVVSGSLLLNIRYLTVHSCVKLENATWILHLPYLEALGIVDCPKMEHVIGNEEGGSSTRGTNEQQNLILLPNLKCVRLSHLPELRSFSTHGVALPSLKYRYVRGCPELDMSSCPLLQSHRSAKGYDISNFHSKLVKKFINDEIDVAIGN